MTLAEIQFDPSLVEQVPRRRKDTAPKLDPSLQSEYPKIPQARQTRELKTIQDGLTQAFGFMGMGLSMVNLYDAMVIHENAELLAKHWTKVAEQNPTVKKYLLNALQGGVWAGAISVSIAVLIPIAANHGTVPDDIVPMTSSLGVVLPDDSYKVTAIEDENLNGDGSTTP